MLYIATTGLSPSQAIPAANETLCCSAIATSKNLSLKSSGFIIVVTALVIGLFWLPILSKIGILSIVDTFGAFFGPIFGIMIADHYLIKNKEIVNKDIFSSNSEGTYYYSNGWQIKSIYANIR